MHCTIPLIPMIEKGIFIIFVFVFIIMFFLAYPATAATTRQMLNTTCAVCAIWSCLLLILSDTLHVEFYFRLCIFVFVILILLPFVFVWHTTAARNTLPNYPFALILRRSRWQLVCLLLCGCYAIFGGGLVLSSVGVLIIWLVCFDVFFLRSFTLIYFTSVFGI